MLDIPIQLFHLEDASAPDSNSPLFDVSLTDETPPEDLLKLRLDYALTKAQAAISGSIFWFTYKGCVFFVSYKTNTIQSVMEYTNGNGQLAFVGPSSSPQVVKALYDGMRKDAAAQEAAPYPPKAEAMTIPERILSQEGVMRTMMALDHAYKAAGDSKTVSFELDGQTFYVNQNSAIGGLRIEASRNKDAKHVGPAPTKETADFLETLMNKEHQEELGKFYKGLHDAMSGSPDDTTRDMLESIIHLVPLG